ncbi:C4-dicarboxylate transport protein DctA (plasmid) [Cupriavidus necator N-1]|uniref:C4-dicarboxylate transport protein DctA n=1 Tax=Cupriavidus necator (strain ATCC 43291 / DSM 13513 / CCUG 52238 / LMG 8453 / N-1) TaxID=1042878 RepID=F8GUL2_CUPNN|nr:C4-dicarboxylate transport protein DctA [Cupriavidus necator N-1]
MPNSVNQTDVLSTRPGSLFRFVARNLYVQVLLAMAIGITLGHYYPEIAAQMKPFGDGFIKLIKMTIGMVIFFTVVSGIAGMQSFGKVGKVGGIALLYFEIVSTIALLIGLVVANIIKPGESFNVDPAKLDASQIKQYVTAAQGNGLTDFFLNIIPKTLVGAFTSDSILSVVFVSILMGLVLGKIGDKGRPIRELVDACSHWIFGIINMIMRFAPIGAFGAMAFTVGKFGIASLQSLVVLISTFYLTAAIFVFVVLGAIGYWYGFSIFTVLRHFRSELVLVLATSSSDAALPALMRKLENVGCKPGTVGLVMPAGYVFNSDGTNIYITMAVLFIAQAMHVELTIWHQLMILGVATLTTKGSAGVPGAGFVSLVATLALVPEIPLVGVTMLLGIDRIISEGRALVNVIGNVVATLVIARREGEVGSNDLQLAMRTVTSD